LEGLAITTVRGDSSRGVISSLNSTHRGLLREVIRNARSNFILNNMQQVFKSDRCLLAAAYVTAKISGRMRFCFVGVIMFSTRIETLPRNLGHMVLGKAREV
jgi:hypothetical protein